MAPQLRVYAGLDDECETPGQPATVQVSLGELLPLIAIAQRGNYAWLRDFLDDEVAITEDLYQVLRAFRVNRPSA